MMEKVDIRELMDEGLYDAAETLMLKALPELKAQMKKARKLFKKNRSEDTKNSLDSLQMNLARCYTDLADLYQVKKESSKELAVRREFLQTMKTFEGATEVSFATVKLLLAECLCYRCQLNPNNETLKLFQEALIYYTKDDRNGIAYHRALLGISLLGEPDDDRELLLHLVECYDFFKKLNAPDWWRMTLKGLVRFSEGFDEYSPAALVWMQELINILPNTRIAAETEMKKFELLLRMQRFDIAARILANFKAVPVLTSRVKEDIQKMEQIFAKANAEGKSSKNLSAWRMCQNCNAIKKKKEMFKCGGCQMVSYCDAKCQHEDWAEHKTSCERNSLAK